MREHACACVRLCKRAPRLARSCFLAFDTKIDEPLIGIALHGRDAKHLRQAHHLKDRLQLPQLSWHYSFHQTAQRRWRGRATDPILYRNLRQHAAIVFVCQLAFPDIRSKAAIGNKTKNQRPKTTINLKQRPHTLRPKHSTAATSGEHGRI